MRVSIDRDIPSAVIPAKAGTHEHRLSQPGAGRVPGFRALGFAEPRNDGERLRRWAVRVSIDRAIPSSVIPAKAGTYEHRPSQPGAVRVPGFRALGFAEPRNDGERLRRWGNEGEHRSRHPLLRHSAKAGTREHGSTQPGAVRVPGFRALGFAEPRNDGERLRRWAVRVSIDRGIPSAVIPAKAGIHLSAARASETWIPACAGMTVTVATVRQRG